MLKKKTQPINNLTNSFNFVKENYQQHWQRKNLLKKKTDFFLLKKKLAIFFNMGEKNYQQRNFPFSLKLVKKTTNKEN